MAVCPADEALAERLRSAALEPVGRFATASNTTLLCRLGTSDGLAIYKPRRGEAPLWDFPDGTLYRREVAAWVVDRALGWRLVPVTVLRDDGPFGPGSVQEFVHHDPDRHYFWLHEHGDDAVRGDLLRMVLLDLVINNADRKASHVLLAADGRVRLVDHGVSFHADPKLRTVAWDFAGEQIPTEDRREVAALAGRLAGPSGGDSLAGDLDDLLAAEEVAALAARCRIVAELATFPEPTGPRPFPWPLL